MQYWDSISCLAGEVDNPSRTFPRALLWAVLLVVASYFLPTLAALGVAVDTADWSLGYYGKVAQQVRVVRLNPDLQKKDLGWRAHLLTSRLCAGVCPRCC
jgi:amino acid transporter